MSQNRQNTRAVLPREQVMEKLGDVLAGIRVPNLPYPVGKPPEEAVTEWQPLLSSCWTEQRDERVIQLIQSVSLTWSVRQINAAYLADRIMDVFLKTSGLHLQIARRIARLRFFLAWRLNDAGAAAFTEPMLDWLDGLQELRGWSDSGGRSSKAVLDQLDSLIISVSACFEHTSGDPFEGFCKDWLDAADRRRQQVDRLAERLLETEQGAARQRRAEQTARALVGRALSGRMLPPVFVRFIFDYWMPLLKQVVWSGELGGENGRHGGKLLEWLVWVGDPSLSDQDRNRLYHVGEQIGDRILDVWRRVQGKDLPSGALDGLQETLVARLRGETPELVPALPEPARFEWDASWLTIEQPDSDQLDALAGRWFVEGEGDREQRRFFSAVMPDTAEILWTNGSGVKLGLQSWRSFLQARERDSVRPLPAPTPFGNLLSDTVEALASVLERQRALREQAAAEARARAEALRQEKEAAEARRRAEEARRQEEIAHRQQLEQEQRDADEKAEQARILQEHRLTAEKLIDSIKLGGWIVYGREGGASEPVRLKLAVRINASRKLVFVDRLGLNRREFRVDAMVEEVIAGNVRVLGSSAEFGDTLSRVVGRIRVGRT